MSGFAVNIAPPRLAESTALGEMAAILGPGMARVLEKLVASHLLRLHPVFTAEEKMLLQCAAAALSIVNHTPGAAQQIGREAAGAIRQNPDASRLELAVASMDQRLIGMAR